MLHVTLTAIPPTARHPATSLPWRSPASTTPTTAATATPRSRTSTAVTSTSRAALVAHHPNDGALALLRTVLTQLRVDELRRMEPALREILQRHAQLTGVDAVDEGPQTSDVDAAGSDDAAPPSR